MAVAPRTRARQTILVVVVALTMTIAGGLGTVLVLEQKAGGSPSVVNDGPTLFQAIAQVNDSVQKEAGGPWAIFSVFGIAAQLPFSPNVIGYPEVNAPNVCGDLYDGLTLWNGSIPVFSGTFNSGTAPFWQFSYFSNASQEVLLVTDVLGAVHVFSPQPYPGPCNPWNPYPEPLVWSEALTRVSEDSSVAASAAWKVNSPDWPSPSEPFVQIITLGPNIFDSTGYVTGGYLIMFERCGLVGVAGVQPDLSAAVNWSSTEAVGSGPGGGNCALLNSYQGKSGEDYDLLFSPPSVNTSLGTVQSTAGFQVAQAFASNGTLTGYDWGWGLANWMTHWNLSTSSGSRLALAPSGCDSWVPSIADCSANSSGWYAVVLSASGEWTNSYGALPNGTAGWAEPVTALVSHQQLAIVAPNSWDLAGDALTVSSTVTNTTVLGSLTL